MAKAKTTTEVQIVEMTKGVIRAVIVGESPMLCNRLSEKTKRTLTGPTGRKTQSEKASSLKHNPVQEFRDSPYWLPKGSDALIAVKATAFKGAMMTAALETPGMTKAAIGRRVYVRDEYIPIYGIPKLHMDCVRSADMNKTPDVRFRAILPEWAAIVDIEFVKPLMRAKEVLTLLAGGGMVAGIGDFRPEKGKGAYGRYRLVSETDKDFKRIVKACGYDAQVKAMDDAEPYDDETREMLAWFKDYAEGRGFEIGERGELSRPTDGLVASNNGSK